jgi:hypothetical protein
MFNSFDKLLLDVSSAEGSEAMTSDLNSNGLSMGYIISDENKWGWITLYDESKATIY